MAAVLAAASPSPTPPRRIVALAPSAAEILFALGAAPRVVGVSDFARDLPGAAGKTRLGGFAPDLERVVALAPDLVVVSRDGTDRAAWEKLTAMGLTVLVTSGTSLDGVLDDVVHVGAAIGEPGRAASLVRALKERIAAAEAKGRAHRGKTALVLVWPDPPVVAGRATFVGDVLARAGFTNAVPASAGDWPRVSLETLAAWNPDLVVRPATAENAAAFGAALQGGAFRVVPAVRDGRVATLPGDLLERPGPRLVDALEALAALGSAP
ncbi:MAG TPA: helical backbone metal receptor [Thermoanaerobaculia bacterium]|nr:helical backbone metal receptor [Thermoanaerobaculia bacterium]